MIDVTKFKVPSGTSISLKDYSTGSHNQKLTKADLKDQLDTDIKRIKKTQYRLYAENKRSLLIIFQAIDAAGKDGAIRHVMSGINPQGCDVHSFKKPTSNELDHDYLWRHYIRLPDRGRIGIFNRSHYENVLVTKVHPEYIMYENLHGIDSVDDITPEFWEKRYHQINDFERIIVQNGTRVLKFFLHLSKGEQKERFMERINNPEKHWKFSHADLEERALWDNYQEVFETAINKTSTRYAPWYIVPADNKWYTRMSIANIIANTLEEMSVEVPKVDEKQLALLQEAKQQLLNE